MSVLLERARRMLSSKESTSFPLTTWFSRSRGARSGAAGFCLLPIPSTLSSVEAFCAHEETPHNAEKRIATTNGRTTLIDHPPQDCLIVNPDYSYRMASTGSSRAAFTAG